MHLRHAACVGVVGSILWAGAAPADAATITSVNQFILPGFSTGSLSVGAPVSPNNDNTAAPSPDLLAATIFLNAGGFGNMDYEFNVADSGGTTEYFFTTTVVNNTGIAWTDFHFQLGFGTGANFLPLNVASALDFDAPGNDPAPTSSIFPVLNHQWNVVEWSGATVNYAGSPAGGPVLVAFSLSIDVPDGIVGLNPQGVNRFTLRSFPTAPLQAPEPTTAALLGVGLACAALRRRRRT